MTTTLYLVRHGDTIDEETKKVYKGRLDIPLSQKGVERLTRVARFLSGIPLDLIYSSNLSRCTESSRIIAEPKGLTVLPTDALAEIYFGLWEGLSFDEIAQQFPAEFNRWLKDPEVYPPPGGEPLRDAQKRSMDKIREIVEKHRGMKVAVVAHAGILRMIISAILDIRLTHLFRIGQDYGCISVIDFYDDDRAVLKLLNFTYYE